MGNYASLCLPEFSLYAQFVRAQFDQFFASFSNFAIHFESLQARKITIKHEKQGICMPYCTRITCDNKFVES